MMAHNTLLSPHYQAELARQHPGAPAQAAGPVWWQDRQQRAAQRFAEAGFPDPRQEEWKYTNVRPIASKPFVRPTLPMAPEDERWEAVRERLIPLESAELAVYRVVLVDGVFAPALSRLEGLPEGVRLQSLREALDTHPAAVEPLLGTLAHDRYSSFVSANLAFLQDGLLLQLPAGMHLERPVQVCLLTTTQVPAIWVHPRILVQVGESAQLTLLEQYLDLPGATGCTNVVTELHAAAGARVEHYLLQEHADTAYHVGSVFVRQARDSQVISHNINVGGRLVRHDLNIDLSEPGAEIHLNGLQLVGGRQHVDTHTRVQHIAPHTTSREEYRSIGQGHGRAVFKGRVLVEEGAQKTDAQQHSANLLLSPNAEIDTKPELEIYADDVKCAHGATVGQLDATSLYYLRSRGIPLEQARSLLVFAFADAVLERMTLSPVRGRIEEQIAIRLPQSAAFLE
jgi:Fe-S cluster assembly protein SufD